MLICRDYRNQVFALLIHFAWEWCHDDTETSAFNAHIRLLMLFESVFYFLLLSCGTHEKQLCDNWKLSWLSGSFFEF